jgi:predicted SAM-dependent methyltransferase
MARFGRMLVPPVTTFANQPQSTASASAGGSAQERLAPNGAPGSAVALLKNLTWLKPPYRTAKRLGAWAYTFSNRLRANEITRVQVGSGKDVRSGWWNVDMVRFPGVDEIRDATLPWRHRNLQYVYAEHFIEHLTLHQGLMMMQHAGNALRPGGILRLSTPNLTHVILRNYRVHGSPQAERVTDTLVMNQSFHGYGHQFLYSSEFMRFVLENMGFDPVREYDFGESDDPNLRGLEHHGPFEVDEGIPNIITFEATRGSSTIAPSATLRAFLHKHFDGEMYR